MLEKYSNSIFSILRHLSNSAFSIDLQYKCLCFLQMLPQLLSFADTKHLYLTPTSQRRKGLFSLLVCWLALRQDAIEMHSRGQTVQGRASRRQQQGSRNSSSEACLPFFLLCSTQARRLLIGTTHIQGEASITHTWNYAVNLGITNF